MTSPLGSFVVVSNHDSHTFGSQVEAIEAAVKRRDGDDSVGWAGANNEYAVAQVVAVVEKRKDSA